MEILEIPFNKFIGLKEGTDSTFILELPECKKFLDETGAIHTSALFALAEASSRKYLDYLLDSVKDINFKISSIVQNAKIKYRKPAGGKIGSKARILGKSFQEFHEDLKNKGRVVLEVEVKLLTPEKETVMIAKFEWLINIVKDRE